MLTLLAKIQRWWVVHNVALTHLCVERYCLKPSRIQGTAYIVYWGLILHTLDTGLPTTHAQKQE